MQSLSFSARNRTHRRVAVGALLLSVALVVPVGLLQARELRVLSTPQILAVAIPVQTRIAAIAGSAARATDPSSNQLIQFAVPSPSDKRPLVGQTVWLRPGTGPRPQDGRLGPAAARNVASVAVFVGWPADAHKKNTVSVGYMESEVRVSNTGRIDGKTKIWTNNNVQGFTGGVKVKLQDRNGNVLQWDMPVKMYGVNANNPVSQAGSPSSRTEYWNFPVPAAILQNLGRIRIIHQHTPNGRWDQAIEMAKEAGEVLKTYAEIYETVANAGGGAPGGTRPTGTGPTRPTMR